MNFDIKNRVITGDDSLIIGDNADYIAEFTFDEEWNGITKTARFISCSNSYVDVILEDNKCCIPCEVLKCGYCRVGVYSAEKTTTEHKFFVNKSIKNDNCHECEPTPDVYAQLTGKLDNIQQQMPNEIEKQVGEYLEEHKEEFKGEKGDRGEAGAIKMIIVETLPTENIDLAAIYLKLSESQKEQNIYDEFIYTNGKWEQIGTTAIDLSGYVSQEDFDNALKNGKVTIGKGTSATDLAIAIGNNAQVTMYNNGVAIGNEAKTSWSGTALGNGARSNASGAIQLGIGTNTKSWSLQVFEDNIYNKLTHTLTVQNIELNGVDLGTQLGDLNTALETILGV